MTIEMARQFFVKFPNAMKVSPADLNWSMGYWRMNRANLTGAQSDYERAQKVLIISISLVYNMT
jgi:hypothetical protein